MRADSLAEAMARVAKEHELSPTGPTCDEVAVADTEAGLIRIGCEREPDHVPPCVFYPEDLITTSP